MIFSFSLAYPIILYLGVPVLLLIAFYRWVFYKNSFYKFNFVKEISDYAGSNKIFYKFVPFLLRFIVVFLICVAIARPQKPEHKSMTKVEGIDIMMVMDVSGSMQCFDDLNDRRSRFEVSKNEAIKFINKRTNDALGVVIFAKDVVTRCPLTFDKKMLTDIVSEFQLGQIDHTDTMLGKALVAALSRLEHSKAKTKIIILLTDGEPSPDDISSLVPIEMAQKLGIKIYTIGIGSDAGGYMQHPYFGVAPCNLKLNVDLLKIISQKTGGKFFLAKSPEDIEKIYEIIDNLEKSEIDAPISVRYKDYFLPLLVLGFIFLSLEIFATTTIWSRL